MKSELFANLRVHATAAIDRSHEAILERGDHDAAVLELRHLVNEIVTFEETIRRAAPRKGRTKS